MATAKLTRETRWGRWLAAALLALATLVVPSMATMASAEVGSGDSVYVGKNGPGYGGTRLYPIYSNGTGEGEPDYFAYCIEHDLSAKTGLLAQVGDLDSYLGANYFETDPAVAGKVLWVLAHSYPALSLQEFGAAVGVPNISQNDAIEATQYAIWRYTDLTWDATWTFETPDSKTAYWYLVNGANANAGMTPADFEVTASVTAPAAAQTADSLVGPFLVHTNQATAGVTADPAFSFVDASGNAIDAGAVTDGQELYLDLRGSTAAGSATVTVTASGSSATGKVVSVPTTAGGTPTADSHAQSMTLVTPSTTKTTGQASVEWAASAAPVIGTSLVDAADRDRVVAWNGGTVIDTVAYQNLKPGTEYTVTGELMRKSDGSATGITGSAKFTPAEANGSVEVSFTIPSGYAGETLVAFEKLYSGSEASGTPAATHEDIDDAAQTVVVGKAPAISTTLVDDKDRDHNLVHSGGTVTDTISYENLTPGQEYTVTGELMRKSDGSATGITGSAKFTPAEANGSVEVSFTIPEGYAGEALVAFERLFAGAGTSGEPVAVHEDINDAAQTVTVEKRASSTVKPGAPAQSTGLATTGSLPIGGALVLALLAVIGGAALVFRRRRA